jgi:hypothetical protein
MFEAELGAHAESEMALSKILVDRLETGMVLLADRGFCSFDLWKQASATGADLLWRANTKPRRIATLDDGSWLAELRRNNAKLDTEHVVVRVVDYDVDDGRNIETGPFRLFTTLLDPAEVSAVELAAAYAQRWEIESAFDELKTHQRGARTVLRSKSPELVKQEIWGHLCCHNAIRTLMFAAAHRAGDSERRLIQRRLLGGCGDDVAAVRVDAVGVVERRGPLGQCRETCS